MKKTVYVILITGLVTITLHNTNLKILWLRYTSFGLALLIYYYLIQKAIREDKNEEYYNQMKRTIYIFWTTLFVSLIIVSVSLEITWLRYTILVVSGAPYILLFLESVSEYSIEKGYNSITRQVAMASEIQNQKEDILKRDTTIATQQKDHTKKEDLITIKQILEPRKEEHNKIQNLIQIQNVANDKDKK